VKDTIYSILCSSISDECTEGLGTFCDRLLRCGGSCVESSDNCPSSLEKFDEQFGFLRPLIKPHWEKIKEVVQNVLNATSCPIEPVTTTSTTTLGQIGSAKEGLSGTTSATSVYLIIAIVVLVLILATLCALCAWKYASKKKEEEHSIRTAFTKSPPSDSLRSGFARRDKGIPVIEVAVEALPVDTEDVVDTQDVV